MNRMKGILRFISLALILFSSFAVLCQEKISPEDYEFPKNTIKASRTYAVFALPQQSFAAQSMVDRYNFQNGLLTYHIREDQSANRFIEEKFSYEKGGLSKKEIIRTSSSGTEYTRFIFRTDSNSYKSTLYKIGQTGSLEKIIDFRNDTGELRGQSFYNTSGKRTKQIEYGGKEGHRIKKYHNEQLVSDIIYRYNPEGRISETIIHTMPGKENEPKVWKITSYNEKGDAIKTLEYHRAKEEDEKRLNKTHYTAYLYDLDVWIAKIEYTTNIKDPAKLVVAIRSLVIGDKTYQPQNDEQLIRFCKQVYQKYLTQTLK